jgi:TM2 domain-containing membrane protein YozV
MPTVDRRRPDPLDPDADLDGFTSDELEESLFGADPDRPRRPAPRRAASRPAAPATKFCHACASTLDARAEICPDCGVRQPALRRRAPHADRSRFTAALLAFFVGAFGVHKFYLGRTGAGIAYLLFFWTAIPAFLGFVDFIILLTMTDERFDEKYG